MSELFAIHPVHAHHDLTDKFDISEVVDDSGQRIPLNLGIERWQDEGHWPAFREFAQLGLLLIDRRFCQLVKRTYQAVLVEIRHRLGLNYRIRKAILQSARIAP